VTLQPEALDAPLTWRKPRNVFVNSMSDLLHDDVPLEYIKKVFAVMERADWHTFQILTKRAERLEEVALLLPWPRNVWMGVTVENAECTSRIAHLVKVPAAVRFLSIEPLLGPILRAGMDALFGFTSQDVPEQEANQERASDYERSVRVGIFADTPGSFPNLPLSSGYFRGVVVYDSLTGRFEVVECL
jgi:hypothetical protein